MTTPHTPPNLEPTMRRYTLSLALAVLTSGLFVGGAQAQNRKPNLYLLTVGASKHANASGEFRDLRFAAKDSEDLAAFYRKQKGKLYGEVYSYVLTNEKATRASIENALAEMAKLNIRSDDHVVVQLSGHGAPTFF